MDIHLEEFSQNRKKGNWPEVIRVSEIFGFGYWNNSGCLQSGRKAILFNA